MSVGHPHTGEHAHHELGFLRKYIFSEDHKIIGIQFLFSGLIFFLIGGILALLVRIQPGKGPAADIKYRPSDKEPFMNERQREYFRQKLLAWKEEILKEAKETLAHLQAENENHPDLADAGPVLRPNALPGSLGIPEAFGSALVVMPWNDAEAIGGYMSEHGDEVAAILTEPVMGNTGVIPPNPGYLELLRDLSTRHGSVLIFDEVITGFRVALGGAQAKYGVTPDLTTMAKALGGGFPVSAIGGKRSLMELVADGRVLHAGTYNASTLATAAVKASLGILSRPRTYERLYAISERLQQGIGSILTDAGVAVQVQGVGPMFQTWFSETPVTNYREAASHLNSPRYATLVRALLARGVMVHPSNIELWFVSTVHTDAHVDRVLDAFADAVSETREILVGTADD